MRLFKKNILIISPEPWDHIFVSKHHYAIHLAKKGNRVFFLGPPGEKEWVMPTLYENLFVVSYKGFISGLRYLPVILQRRLILAGFRRIERLASVKFDVVWSFDNSVFFDFSALPSEILKISHIVDASQDFQTERAAKTADICFSVTDQIQSRLSPHNLRVYKVGHAFSPAVDFGQTLPKPVGSNNVRAIYAGNLSIPYIDWLSILKLVETHPVVDFVFAGPNGDVLDGDLEMRSAKQQVLSQPNVSFIGSIPSQELHQWYATADILILVYQEKFQDDQVASSHKMMQYLGSGKMIVASFTHEYKHLAENGLILMSKRNSALCSNFTNASKNLIYWNSEKMKQARIDFAMACTYEKQIEKIETILFEN